MILQALNEYYERLKGDPEAGIAQPGFSNEQISAVIVINRQGDLVQFKDIRSGEGRKKSPVFMIVPNSFKRPASKAHEKPFFLWDNTGFVLGRDDKGDDEKAKLKFKYFKLLHQKLLADSKNEASQALLNFLEKWDINRCESLPKWDELIGKNVVFQIDGEMEYLHQKNVLKQIWINSRGDGSIKYTDGICAVTGTQAHIPNIHVSIKGVKNAQPSGASIISFNQDSFCSYGKEQNYNAPVSKEVAFAYTTALNYLLKKNSRQKIQIGDATTVFWTEKDSPVEKLFGIALDPHDEELSDNAEITNYLKAIKVGKLPDNIDENIKFYILGLSPNNSRLSVRFWYVSNVGDVSEKLGQHFQDLQIQKQFTDKDPEYPGLWRLLNETTNKKSKDGPPPLLAGAVMQSVIQGTLYPQTLLSLILNRIRADQSINYIRAAIIKAILVRRARIFNRKEMEVSMSLDTNNKQPAYLLGRLFAVLEKVQQDAIPGANSTIKDRFYGSASATPRIVFPQLLRLAQHHISKAEYGGISDKKIEEIICDLPEFPAHLSIEQQGLFAIGYYHQRQDLFKKREAK